MTRGLVDADLARCSHPREMIDLVCIADVGTWSAFKIAGLAREFMPEVDWEGFRASHGLPQEGGVETTIIAPHNLNTQPIPKPIGAMFATLIGALAREDSELRLIADYFRKVGLEGASAGNPRAWSWDVYSPEVRSKVARGGLRTGDPWDEWDLAIP